MIKTVLLLTLYLFSFFVTVAQNTDRFWAFGDSAAIDFSNLNNPVPSYSILRSRGTCASICDSVGDLLFYCGSPHEPIWSNPNVNNCGYVANKNHQIMQNGDSLRGTSWYQEMIIVPNPGNSNQYYIFCSGVLAPNNGLFYSLVDMSFNNGLGKVIQKNIQLNSDYGCDGITAVKHGNGRDWWLVFRNWKYYPLYSNEIKVYQVSPTGITANPTQLIGTSMTDEGFLRSKFNASGNKMYTVSTDGLIENYDFDRCTGMLSNPTTFSTLSGPPYVDYWGFEVSPDESKIYVTSIYQTGNQDTSYLIQFDLNAANFLASADTLGTFLAPDLAGLLQLGPDNKIYLSVTWAWPDTCNDYLYCYGTVNTTNSNISVINFPDSSGSACGFQAFSFYLGGHKAYTGLPNNPNYELAKDSGSVCDTLTVGINELIGNYSNLFVYYDPQWKVAFINADKLTGRKYDLEIYDISGRKIIKESGNLDSGADGYQSFTLDLDMSSYNSGLYIISLTTEKEKLVKKFVKP